MLHSAYDPEQEAGRFAAAAECAFFPSFIIVTEPALSYCASFLREKYPGAVLYAVRYDRAFSFCDNAWDSVFYVCDSSVPFQDRLFAEIGEEGIFSSLFLSWSASSRAFPDIDRIVWDGIRSAVLKSRDILHTRTYFSSRWVSNIFSFCRFLSNVSLPIRRGTCPVVVTASGPSLTGALPQLKKYRSSFFLIAVSSSLSVLLYYGIIPDVCLSTDGGYYAGKHLAPYADGSCSVPLALTPESFCSGRILTSTAIIPLSYGDAIESQVLSDCGIRAFHAERNGTVSGTAAEYALSLTSGPVFLCGLDLSPSSGYQHAQPNRLETEASSYDTRTSTKELRTTAARFSSNALSVYRGWFESLPAEKAERLFRLSDNFSFSNTLGAVADVTFSALKSACGEYTFPQFAAEAVPSEDSRMQKERQFIVKNAESDEWLHSVFPADYLGLRRSHQGKDADSRKDVLRKKNASLVHRLERKLHE